MRTAWRVLQAARAASPSTQVVIITGYASLDSAITAVRLGAYDYLTKPFSLGQIDVLLARVEDRLALEAENRALQRRIDTREAETAHAAQDRLGAIEARLRRDRAYRCGDLVSELTRRRQSNGAAECRIRPSVSVGQPALMCR